MPTKRLDPRTAPEPIDISRQPAPGEPGSIEQQLDMVEDGPMRGDEILHHPGEPEFQLYPKDRDPLPVDRMMDRMEVNLSEENREGDEMSGDEHSSGLQGEDSEEQGQPHFDSGLPGERTEDEAKQIDERITRRRAS
jgi:hypothetical protein